MNTFQLVGGIISIFGTVLMFYGSYLQGHSDKIFQSNVQEFVEDQKDSDVPKIVALRVKKSQADYILTVKNVGKKSATKVKVIFTKESTPSAFVSNFISGAKEIPNDVEYTFPLNLFSGINTIMQLPNSDESYKKTLQDSLDKFNSGKIAFIPRFQIEYYFEDRKFTSSTYYLILEQKRGLRYFGKEE